MYKQFPITTKLFISGFSINPIVDINMFKIFIKSFLNYGDKHMCDFNPDIYHQNYIKNPISEPFAYNALEDNKSILIGGIFFEKGYLFLKIRYDIYPAKIELDISLNDKIEDPILIIDHLSCPAIPGDGLGLFDYNYNLLYTTSIDSILHKQDKSIPSYMLNEPFTMSEENQEKNHWILNKLSDNISCYFCLNKADTFIFFDLPRRVVPVCTDHKTNGDTKELMDFINDNMHIPKIDYGDIRFFNKDAYIKHEENDGNQTISSNKPNI